jgi:hypothetical protein
VQRGKDLLLGVCFLIVRYYLTDQLISKVKKSKSAEFYYLGKKIDFLAVEM